MFILEEFLREDYQRKKAVVEIQKEDKVADEIIHYKYKDKRLNRLAFIARRTKKKRIREKVFTELFYGFLRETDSSVSGRVVQDEGEYKLIFNEILWGVTRTTFVKTR